MSTSYTTQNVPSTYGKAKKTNFLSLHKQRQKKSFYIEKSVSFFFLSASGGNAQPLLSTASVKKSFSFPPLAQPTGKHCTVFGHAKTKEEEKERRRTKRQQARSFTLSSLSLLPPPPTNLFRKAKEREPGLQYGIQHLFGLLSKSFFDCHFPKECPRRGGTHC